MFKKLTDFFMNVICEDDAHTQIDPIILGAGATLLTFLGLSIYYVATTHSFSFTEFGIGSATILGGAGGGKWAKAKGDAAK